MTTEKATIRKRAAAVLVVLRAFSCPELELELERDV